MPQLDGDSCDANTDANPNRYKCRRGERNRIMEQ